MEHEQLRDALEALAADLWATKCSALEVGSRRLFKELTKLDLKMAKLTKRLRQEKTFA